MNKISEKTVYSSMSKQHLPDLRGIEVLLFDLGGVIIDIDPSRTDRAFDTLGAKEWLRAHSKAEQDPLFDRLERGELDADAFRKELRERTGIEASDDAIDEAWNALLMDVPLERIHFLERMKEHYQLHLFSNTNPIHVEGFEQIVGPIYGMDRFRELFDGIHLSYELGVRKPDPWAFQLVADRIGIRKERTLFIDDTEAHVKAARSKGIRAYHLGDKEDVTDLEDELFPQAFS